MDQKDYITSGFDKFLSRDSQSLQGPLDVETNQGKSIPFDRTQVGGFQGDTFKIGPVRITNKGIIMEDENGVDILLIGEE